MNIHTSLRMVFGLSLVLAIGQAAYARAPSTVPAKPTPVSVSRPAEQDMTDCAVFPAWTAAVDSVELRARVWGYLDKSRPGRGG